MRPCTVASLAAILAVLALLTACAVGRPWTETRFEAASQAVTEGQFDVAYSHLDSLVEYGDGAVRAAAIARIKSDPRILAAGPVVIARTLALNASSIDAADFESEARFKASLVQRHAAVDGTMQRYKALVPEFNENSAIERAYLEAKVSNADRVAAYRRNQQLLERLAKAESLAQYDCGDKRQCDKAFSLAQIFVSAKSDMKIQVATDSVIETYNPIDAGRIGMKVIRMPRKGDSATIIVTIGCKEGGPNECALRKIGVYEAFTPFVSSDP